MIGKNKDSDIIITYLFLIVLMIELVLQIFSKDFENIKNTILTISTTILISYILNKSRFKVGGSLLHVSIIIFIFLSMYLGKIKNMYFIFPNWDKFLHLSSGFITTILGLAIIYRIGKKEIEDIIKIKGIILFLIIFSIAMAGIWELYEYITDLLLGLQSQRGSLDDTMQDMICASVVTLITCIPLYISLKGNNNLIDKLME